MKYFFRIVVCMAVLSGIVSSLKAQVDQIEIARVEQMPNEPSPYNMRDWHEVALGYDSFVYDITKAGLYLPLVFVKPQGVNYPGNPSFGLDTYVGTFSNDNGEAINVLPSLVGATLAGIDKTDQFGRNWILMSQDYFNRGNGENIYLNNIGGHSGSDWWYDMMPNIYFYQLYDLYGKIGDAENQFHSVAERMAEAVGVMGGKATPWTRAFMDYRAYDFLNMEPNPNGVHEPEAAGAYAWLLYHAYKKTGDISYLQAAEWSMEFLINLSSNPSYELQLPYGAYIAAKMNAEIGTEYNIEKLLFWIFNRGPLRGWGTIVGNWNGFDVSGLVGEANDGGNDYAFQLNGTQQAGALVPLVRYDKRFARTVGKWMLNVSNATRLMFPGYLPAHLQDASAWSELYDPAGVIGYEALREIWNGMSPLATGDALRSGWAATNLSLYSTSSIGYMGSIIEKTNEEKILRLDLLKTDFFKDTAYPSFLYYNPFSFVKSVTIDVGTEAKDIYDVISESFIAHNATGETEIEISADAVLSIVLTPPDGVLSYDKNKMLVDGVVVDYKQTIIPYNYPPRIQALATENLTIEKNSTVTFYGKGIDQETKDLIYTFFLPDDTISGIEKTAAWTAPDQTGSFDIKLVVEDEGQLTDTAIITITIVDEINIAPVIINLNASRKYATPGETITLTAHAEDLNNDPLSYTWTATAGTINGSGEDIDWTAPLVEGIYTISLTIEDGRGGVANENIQILVIDLDLHIEGEIIAWYPFAGNANDISGNNLHGQVLGAKLTTDSIGNPNEAYFFDGNNDHIRVINDPILNFDQGITLSLFANPGTIGDKERFIISHGSWQNRWKLSITPEHKIRWTLKTKSGQVRDIDSETMVEEDRNYHIGASYNGRFMMLYINGRLESFSAFSGEINASPVDLEIGQIFPDDPSYNFGGVLDEIKIYDYALLPDSVAAESGSITSVNKVNPVNTGLLVFPNPARGSITLDFDENSTYDLPLQGKITILGMTGEEIFASPFEQLPASIQLSTISPGIYILRLTSEDRSFITKLIIQ